MHHYNHIYFLGIGGIGMSALARYFQRRGVQISGYDKTPTGLTRTLQREGMMVHYEDDPSLIPKGIDLVVYTPAIPAGNHCYVHLSQTAVAMKKRAEVLGLVTHNKPTIAVAGTHGKTTISCLLAHIMVQAGIPIEALLGGIATNYNSNYLGSDNPKWTLVEADEYDRSFLHLRPDIALITAIDADHLDIYGSTSALQDSFSRFTAGIKPGGRLLIKEGIPRPPAYKGEMLTYHFNLQAEYQISGYKIKNGQCFVGFRGRLDMPNTRLGLPGKHNAENALAASALAHMAGVGVKDIRKGLSTFEGVKRRLEICYDSPRLSYIDDYAHHPAELDACIQAVRELYPNRKVTGIFQPHLYSRTRDLAAGFAASLGRLDELIMLDIYPAREMPVKGITASWLMDQVNTPAKTLASKEQVLDMISNMQEGVLITMGAGNIDQLVDPIKNLLKAKTGA